MEAIRGRRMTIFAHKSGQTPEDGAGLQLRTARPFTAGELAPGHREVPDRMAEGFFRPWRDWNFVWVVVLKIYRAYGAAISCQPPIFPVDTPLGWEQGKTRRN
jgi:hypothetical protein